jgi:hypothetical protein
MLVVQDESSAAHTRLAALNHRLARFLERRRLPYLIVALGVGLTLPSLFTGFHLDDLIGRFIFSPDLPGASRLYSIYSGGYGAASGNPADAAWMIEEGYAPWWMDPGVLLSFYRPVSLATHLLDAKLWPNSALLWHAHSLLWFAVLLFTAVRTYRSLQGPAIGGLAALLFAVDHTHALAVGFITNRYILVATAFCLLTLEQHHHAVSTGSNRARALAPLSYAVALLAGESSAAVVGYLLGYALFVDSRRLLARALSLAPYVVVSLGWRVLYNALGHGARGSDLYIDPVREPLRFAAAVFERGPMLLLGQWFMPPAETYTLIDASLARLLSVFAWIFAASLALALWSLLRRDRMARFWAMGMVLSLVPMCSGEPNNRMLFVASIGAAGLIAQWWQLCGAGVTDAARSALTKFSRGFGAAMLWGHLLVFSWLVPVNACSLVLLTSLKRAFADVGPDAAGSDAVFVTSPDYFAVRLMKMTKAVEHAPAPKRWRALAYGPEQVTVTRTGLRTLVLAYEGGAMREPAVTKQALDLYRSKDAPLVKGQTVSLEGLAIDVLEVTEDGRPLRVRFDFAEPLDSPRYRFYHWVDNHFREMAPPAVGDAHVLPKAIITPEWPG